MDKETIIDYVMNTPHNANRQVLEGMLNAEGSGGGGSEPLIVTPTESGLETTFEEIDSAVNEHRNIFIGNYPVAGVNKIVPPAGSAQSYYELVTMTPEPGTSTIFFQVNRVNTDNTVSSRVFTITGTIVD